MLSAANVVADFIVGSKVSSAADDLADHIRCHGNYFTGGQFLEATPRAET
jgi:hypothetical protein